MEIKCKCGEVVVKGSVRHKDKKKGGQKKIFEIEVSSINGEIRRNNSSDPEKWSGVCKRCQKENTRNKKVAENIAEKI